MNQILIPMKKTFCGLFAFLVVFSGFGQSADKASVRQEVDSLIQVSRALTGSRDFEKAMEVHAVAEKLVLEKFGRESEHYGKVCFNHGWILQSKGNYPAAEKWYLESRAIREKVLGKEHADYASSLHQLGAIYYLMGNNYDKAEQYYLQAKLIRERTLGKEDIDYAATLNALGHIYFYTANYKLAEEYYHEAMVIREKKLGKENIIYSGSLNNLGLVYTAMRQYDKAESFYKANIAIIEKTKGKQTIWYAGGILNLANIYLKMKDYGKAESLLLESKNILDALLQTDHPNYMSCMETLGVFYFETGKYDLSETYLLKAKSLRGKFFGKEHLSYEMSLADLSVLYWKMGRQADAATHFSETAVRQRAHLSNAARHFSENEVVSYLSIFRSEIDQLFSFATAHSGAFPLIADASYDNALFHRGYLLNTAFLIRNSPEPELAEKLNLLKSCRQLLSAEYSKPVSEQDHTRVLELEEQTNAIEKDITRSFAGYGDAIRQVSWQEVQSALKPGEAALEFIHFNYYTPERTDSVMYAALLLKPGMERPLFIPLLEEKQLRALFLTSEASLNSDQVNELYGVDPSVGKNALYRLLWAPLETHLSGLRTVYYSPGGLLHRINLAALPVDAQTMLSDRYELVALGSTRYLVLGNQRSNTKNATALIYGDIQFNMDSTAYLPAKDAIPGNRRGLSFRMANTPDDPGGSNDWQYLKWSSKEVENVQMTLNKAGMSVEVRKGWQATEESFKQISQNGPSPHILHLSTHGFFFNDPSSHPNETGAPSRAGSDEPVFKISEHPMIRSGLILAGANHAWKTGAPLGNREDGILTAYEISQLDLRQTELVVLSACETGLGHIEGNEGVYGLQRAFKIAGARHLIMSLWQVPDYQTQELMTVFYQKLLLEKRSVRQAMHAAQDEMRRRRYEPYYWAGFVVVE